MPLEPSQKHILRLALRDADADGWTKVCATVWPFVEKMPQDLLETKFSETGGYCRVTDLGKAVLKYC